MPTFAAVDIGANSVRLEVARLVRQRLQMVYEDREVVRLGESVFQAAMLAPSAMARTVKVLRRFHKAVQEHGDVQVRVVATSALRDARNAQAFMKVYKLNASANNTVLVSAKRKVVANLVNVNAENFKVVTNGVSKVIRKR